MKRLYLHYLNLRVSLLRRRLRQMGFREVADRATAETLSRLQMEPARTQRQFLESSLVLTSWLTVFLLLWIAFMLHFYLVSSQRPMKNELRQTVPASVERSYEIHELVEPRSVA